MTILIYPSCRSDQVVSSIRRARSTTQLLLHVAVGANIPDGATARSEIQKEATLLLDFGPALFNPPFVEATNRIMKSAVERWKPANEDLIGFWSDDFCPERGWCERLWESRRAHPEKRFLCCWENIMQFSMSTIPFATWGWWKEAMNGHMWPPIMEYVVDTWVTRRARATGDWIEVPRCRIEHKHYFAGTRKRDHVDVHNFAGAEDFKILEDHRGYNYKPVWGALV